MREKRGSKVRGGGRGREGVREERGRVSKIHTPKHVTADSCGTYAAVVVKV